MMTVHGETGMSTLALNISMQGKRAVIIGGGSVALRKLRTLQTAGAAVTIIAMTLCPEIENLKESGVCNVRRGRYSAADLNSAFMAVAATDDPEVNNQVCADARERGILISVADNPTAGDCTFPATLQRGDLEIAVSTGGRCPTFAVDVRDAIAEHIGREYGTILQQLAKEREKLLTNGSASTYNTQVLRSLGRCMLAELIERKEQMP
jgi:precorrin-2 dehydrogenase/sirohydrochlorin ferrochelatase